MRWTSGLAGKARTSLTAGLSRSKAGAELRTPNGASCGIFPALCGSARVLGLLRWRGRVALRLPENLACWRLCEVACRLRCSLLRVLQMRAYGLKILREGIELFCAVPLRFAARFLAFSSICMPRRAHEMTRRLACRVFGETGKMLRLRQYSSSGCLAVHAHQQLVKTVSLGRTSMPRPGCLHRHDVFLEMESAWFFTGGDDARRLPRLRR